MAWRKKEPCLRPRRQSARVKEIERGRRREREKKKRERENKRDECYSLCISSVSGVLGMFNVFLTKDKSKVDLVT